MKPLPKISRIIGIEPFKLTLLWNTSEIRALDFAMLFKQWEAEDDNKMAALRDWETFKQVALSENRTLCWPNVQISLTYKGEARTALWNWTRWNCTAKAPWSKKRNRSTLAQCSEKRGKMPGYPKQMLH